MAEPGYDEVTLSIDFGDGDGLPMEDTPPLGSLSPPHQQQQQQQEEQQQQQSSSEDVLPGPVARWMSMEDLAQHWRLDETGAVVGSASKYGRVVPASPAAEAAAANQESPDAWRWVAKVSPLNPYTTMAFTRDAHFLQQLQGTGLVPRLGAMPWRCDDSGRGVIIMERLPTDARQYVLQHCGRDIPGLLLRGIANVLRELSAHHIYHGDVKLANFVLADVNEPGTVRAIDFGHASDFRTFEASPFIIGSTLLFRLAPNKPVVKVMLDGEIRDWDQWLNLWALEVNLLCFTQALGVTVDGQPFAGFDLPFNRGQFNDMCTAIIVQDTDARTGGKRQATIPNEHRRYLWEDHRIRLLEAGHRPFTLSP
jgi:hypothetical protein